MAAFGSAFESITNSIDGMISTQLPSGLRWNNIPGTLTKVSPSASGFVWGFSSSGLYVCSLPCTGNWKQVPIDVSPIQDIVTDSSNVYVLGTKTLSIASANGKGPWVTITTPITATKLFSTNTYIWIQDHSGNKQKCPKPCTMPNWIASTDKIFITASNATSLFGVDVSGLPVSTDESLQTGWKPISEMENLKVTSVIDGDYALDLKNNLIECKGNCNPVDTQGQNPLNVIVSPNELWMTTESSGDKGNIFSKLMNPDADSIMSNVAPLDTQRQNVMSKIEDVYSSQTQDIVQSKQIEDTVGIFRSLFKTDPNNANELKQQEEKYEKTVGSMQGKLDQINIVIPPLVTFVFALVLVAIVYIFFSSLGWIVHILALLILGGAYLVSSGNQFTSLIDQYL